MVLAGSGWVLLAGLEAEFVSPGWFVRLRDVWGSLSSGSIASTAENSPSIIQEVTLMKWLFGPNYRSKVDILLLSGPLD